MIKKLIVSNSIALKKKYGARGWADIQNAIARLAVADGLRGITTTFELLDAAGGRVPKTTTAGSEKQVKATIDALYVAHSAPDYMMILGAPDVVPHQTLRNPTYSREDPDKSVPSDLPYACDAPYSTKIGDFVGPTRVVGRLPDVLGGKHTSDLVSLIDAAAMFRRSPSKEAFVLSAAVWKGATAANAKFAFGATKTVALCPPKGPGWAKKALSAPLHFINCHGAEVDEKYYGDPGNFPTAHVPSNLTGVVAQGAVVAAECCYGAELYGPMTGVPLGISTTYLQQGAIAFCGSTNIAYGESTATKRCNADILCTDFMAAIIAKSTTGSALLQARQRFVATAVGGALDPFDLKTLAQFILLGDPSLRPFGGSPGPASWMKLPKGIARFAVESVRESNSASGPVQPAAHRARRRRLAKDGERLGRDTPRASESSGAASGAVRDLLAAEIQKAGLSPGTTLSFGVETGGGSDGQGHWTSFSNRGSTAKAKARTKSKSPSADSDSFEILFGAPSRPASSLAARRRPAFKAAPITVGPATGKPDTLQQGTDLAKKPRPVAVIRAVVARVRDGKVLSYKTVWSK